MLCRVTGFCLAANVDADKSAERNGDRRKQDVKRNVRGKLNVGQQQRFHASPFNKKIDGLTTFPGACGERPPCDRMAKGFSLYTLQC
jgi:hypothetical protein